ncbi:phospholipase domain-containing protein [Nocardioides sp.]|uniref:phospholipase domain-containing protein n=1 Tax=Nocardioides sp. TaxID=35761 RepID=UPI00260B8533|nr:phospholipase domain-containing protein [Nocardioides sp.]
MATLQDLEHLLIVIAEEVPATSLSALPSPVTSCRNYHLTPEGEERAERLWPAFAVALREADVTVQLRASMPDTLGDVTVVEADQAGVEAVLARLDDLPPATLVAIALGGGDADPVEESWGNALGAPGTLLLHTPWTTRDWTSDEVCDHTSLIQLCERWVAERGGEARLWVSEWRRRVCGDLVGAVVLEEDGAAADGAGGGERPLPYSPDADLTVDDGVVTLRLSNTGASKAVHVRVADADGVRGVTVTPSSPIRPRTVSVPVTLTDGGYDVTVTAPGGFRRRFASVAQ